MVREPSGRALGARRMPPSEDGAAASRRNPAS